MSDESKTDNENAVVDEPMDCMAAINHLHEYLDGELSGGIFEQVEVHLDHCRSCFSRAEFEKLLSHRMLETGENSAPSQVKNNIRKLIDNFDKPSD